MCVDPAQNAGVAKGLDDGSLDYPTCEKILERKEREVFGMEVQAYSQKEEKQGHHKGESCFVA